MKHSLENIRAEFPVLAQNIESAKPFAFLDSTATTQKPMPVIQVMNDFYTKHYSSVKRGVYQISEKTTQAFEKARKEIASFINASSENEIIFTSGTTASINLAAWSYGRKFLQAGDEILISALEHHANIVPWQLIAEEKGALLRVIPVDDHANLVLEKISELLTEKTKIVAITHISNVTGTVNPIKDIIQTVRNFSKNAKILIDAAQSIAHQKIDVQELDCDFLAFSGHKMYGPTGIGVLFGKYELLESMPPLFGGGEMIKSVSFEKTTFAPPPARFEAGTPPIAEVIGLGEAVKWLKETGLDNIHRKESEILEYAISQFSEIPEIHILGNPKERGALLSITLEGIHAHDAAMILDEENIAVRSGHHCAEPVMKRFNIPATLRFSFGVYSEKWEIDRALIALKRVIRLFK
ncbi:MAG: cysteine desulfurase [Fibrobacteraceae bacterium]|nr:cysteine desulfurase [Fibrobacteraceae bacterium]